MTPLSPAELRILALLADGLTSPEIAKECGLAIQTVKNHRHSIGNKPATKSTALHTHFALATGLVKLRYTAEGEMAA